MQTLALVLTSVIISIIVGIPIGILASQNERFSKFLKPTLDFMQTMPAFVYLIPAITFSGWCSTWNYCIGNLCNATYNSFY